MSFLIDVFILLIVFLKFLAYLRWSHMDRQCCFFFVNNDVAKKKKTTVNYLRTFLTSSSRNNNNHSIDTRMISVSFSSHYLDMYVYIYIYVWMRHNTLSLTSLRRLLFYHNDFDNHLSLPLSLGSINGQIHLCDSTHSTKSNDSNAIISKGI